MKQPKKILAALLALGVACAPLTACSSSAPAGAPAKGGTGSAASPVSLSFYYPVSVGGPSQKSSTSSARISPGKTRISK